MVFTYEYCSDEATGCSLDLTTVASVVAVDDRNVMITFNEPKPFPYDQFVGYSIGNVTFLRAFRLLLRVPTVKVVIVALLSALLSAEEMIPRHMRGWWSRALRAADARRRLGDADLVRGLPDAPRGLDLLPGGSELLRGRRAMGRGRRRDLGGRLRRLRRRARRGRAADGDVDDDLRLVRVVVTRCVRARIDAADGE